MEDSSGEEDVGQAPRARATVLPPCRQLTSALLSLSVRGALLFLLYLIVRSGLALLFHSVVLLDLFFLPPSLPLLLPV